MTRPIAEFDTFFDYVDLFTAAALADGRVWLVEDPHVSSYLEKQKLTGRARAQAILHASVLRDPFFFHYIHGLKAAAERIDATMELTPKGLRRIEFDLVKLLMLPGLDPKAELLEVAEFCRRLQQLAEKYPQWRLSLMCRQLRHRRRNEPPPAFSFHLTYNPMDQTGRALDLEDAEGLAQVKQALIDLPAVSHFFSRLSATTLRRKFFSVTLDMDELFRFGKSPYMRRQRSIAEKGK